MLRQYNQMKKNTKKVKKKVIKKIKKVIPFHSELRYLRKKLWSFQYRHWGSMNERIIVFKSMDGYEVSGVPKQIYDALLQDENYEDYQFAWMVRKPGDFQYLKENPRTRLFIVGSRKGIRIQEIAYYNVIDQEPPAYLRYRKDQRILMVSEETDYLSNYTYDAFICHEIGCGDGPIKKRLRKCAVLFHLLKKMHYFVYSMRACKKRIEKTMKEGIKKADLCLLKSYYTFTGWLRQYGICLSKNAKEMHTYHNKYQGKRCFLIGNGPSLTIEDLELLKDEITFGCNRIYNLYEKTSWRPDYYCMIDALIAKYSSEELSLNVNSPLFTNINTRDLMKNQPGHLIFARNLGMNPYQVSAHFESYYIPSGATVMTFMLELAMYMGFSDIYLLGVDCTSSLAAKGHCFNDPAGLNLLQKDIDRVRKRLGNADLTAEQVAAYYHDQSTYSYQVIDNYAKEHGFHIYNATRGGMLEVYERKQLEEVLRTAE